MPPPNTRLVFGLVVAAVGSVSSCSDPDPSEFLSDSAARLWINGLPSCEECGITLDTIGVFASKLSPASLRPDAAVPGCMLARPNGESVVVSGVVGGGMLLEYTTEGRYLGASGRAGNGPGELGANIPIVASGDTVFVIDVSNRRVTALDQDGELIGEVPVPLRPHSFARLDDGRWLFHSRPTPSGNSPLFALVDWPGGKASPFGASTGEHGEHDEWVVAPAVGGGYWAASIWDYRIYRSIGDTELRPEIDRDVAWFPDGGRWSPGLLDLARPKPVLLHLYEASAGELCTYTLVADDGWKPRAIDMKSPDWYRSTFDTVVEVIDVDSGNVVSYSRFDDWLAPVCGTGMVYSVFETLDGEIGAVLMSTRQAAIASGGGASSEEGQWF